MSYKRVTREEYYAVRNVITNESYEVRFYGEPVKRWGMGTVYVNRQPVCRRITDLHMIEPTEYYLWVGTESVGA